jgi:hypothetical protein
VYYLKRTDQTLANSITISPNGVDTIDGVSSKTLSTQYENFTIVSDGTSNWNIIDHSYPIGWTSYTPTISSSFGTTSAVSFFWRRHGDSIEIRGYFKMGTNTAAIGTISLPSGLSLNSSALSGTAQSSYIGWARGWTSSGTPASPDNIQIIGDTGTSTTAVIVTTRGANQVAVYDLVSNMFNNSEGFSGAWTAPVSGWNP